MSAIFGKDPAALERVSRTLDGGPPARGSAQPALSRDGRVTAFASDADALVPGDDNHVTDVFVRDRLGVARVTDGHEISSFARVSADGRVIAFESRASNLVPGDANHAPDVFVARDGKVQGVSLGLGDGTAEHPSLSADGRHVAFSWRSFAGGHSQIVVRDLATGSHVVAASEGRSDEPALSGDGRFVAFASDGVLTPGDTNRNSDVFVRDLRSGAVECVSEGLGGGTANLGSGRPAISADGRYVAFQSFATDIVPGTTVPRTGMAESHVYVRDRALGVTRRLDPADVGGVPMGDAYFPSLSEDGAYAVWQATPRRLSHDDDPKRSQVFVAELASGAVQQVTAGDGNSYAPAISGDGSMIAFASEARNLVSGTPPRAASIYSVGNPMPRARARREMDEAARELLREKDAPRVERADGFVVIDGVRVPVRG